MSVADEEFHYISDQLFGNGHGSHGKGKKVMASTGPFFLHAFFLTIVSTYLDAGPWRLVFVHIHEKTMYLLCKYLFQTARSN